MNQNQVDFSTAVKIGSVKEEHLYIRLHHCECGGAFREVMQSLATGPNMEHYDILGAQCMSCKRERLFIFNIGSFFGRH